MDARRLRKPPSDDLANPSKAVSRLAPCSDLAVVSDLSPDMTVTQRELDLLALLLGDRLRAILEDDS